MPGWFRCFDKRPAASVRLICFPFAGGSAALYRPWHKHVAPSVEIQAVQYPGRADRLREPMIGDARELARAIADALPPLLDRPVALYGHSMGAIVAYEVARLLGSTPTRLFVSGSPAAHEEDHEEPIAGLPDDAFVQKLYELGGNDIGVLENLEIRALVLPYVRNDFRLVEQYVHKDGEPLTIPIHTFVGTEDPLTKPPKADRWAELTTGESTLTSLPGDHFFLIPQQSAILAEIHHHLGEAPPH
jgi:surfactin synthase thioesterase subunit